MYASLDSSLFAPDHKFSPSAFINIINQTLYLEHASCLVEGEVASFKINQGKWVFFDLKDAESSLNCFLPRFQLRTPLTDGMKVLVRGTPKLTKWGRFSFTVEAIQPVGKGSIKKSFELLKQQLSTEGLFAPERKRPLPPNLTRIGVISSAQSAGYLDFIKIINARWGGLKITTAHTQVQGIDAPDQIIRALNYFNERDSVQVIAILRGGGSADDLSAFNDEKLARAISASKIPVITGIGHEIDESLADLVADVRASTPSNAAELLSKDRHAEIQKIAVSINRISKVILGHVATAKRAHRQKLTNLSRDLLAKINLALKANAQKAKILTALNPEKILAQGYAILSGKISPGELLKITTHAKIITTEIKNVQNR